MERIAEMERVGVLSETGMTSGSSGAIESPWRKDFPIFDRLDLAYLDSAATSQKPRVVIDAISRVYEESYANVHRSVYALGDRATQLFEASREKVARFINAPAAEEIIFTSGCTESINAVAFGYGFDCLSTGDEIVSTLLEHHANFVPWQQIAERKGAKVRYVGLTADGQWDQAAFETLLSERTKIVAVTHLSNAYGTELPVEQIVRAAHRVGARVVLDAAQSVVHGPLDVQALGVDFAAFSGHKIYGPSGCGVLWGRAELLSQMSPYRYGGNMIRLVTPERTTFNDLPYRLEAGTPNISGVIGLGAAIDYLESIGHERILAHEGELMKQLEGALAERSSVRVLGPRGQHHGLLCFTVDGIHPHDIAQILDQDGVAVRAGHHCAQPLLKVLNIPATTRVSFGLYNTSDDIERFTTALDRAIQFFG